MQNTETTTVAKPKRQSLTIRDHLQSEELQKQIAAALPKHMRPDRMIRIAVTCLNRTPKLTDCTPESFFKCLLDLSAAGLEPDGRHAHIIPYGREATLIIDYKGLVDLCFRSGYVQSIHCDVVHHGDVFEYSLGKVVQHVPWAWRVNDKPEKKGDIIGAYCLVELKDGASHHEAMTIDQLEGIRNRSKAGKSGPWVTDFAEMCKKTVFRRASKWLPISSELREALDRDNDVPMPIVQKHKVQVSQTVTDLFGDEN